MQISAFYSQWMFDSLFGPRTGSEVISGIAALMVDGCSSDCELHRQSKALLEHSMGAPDDGVVGRAMLRAAPKDPHALPSRISETR